MAMKQVRRCVLCAAAFAAVAAVVVAQGGARGGAEGASTAGSALSVPRAPGAGAPPAGAGRPWQQASVSASGSQDAAPERSEAGSLAAPVPPAPRGEGNPGRFGGAPGAQTRGGRQGGQQAPGQGPHGGAPNATESGSLSGPAPGNETAGTRPHDESDSGSVPVPPAPRGEGRPGRFGGAPTAQAQAQARGGRRGPHPGPHNGTSDESETGPAQGSESRPQPPRDESGSDFAPVPRPDDGEHGADHGPHGNGQGPRGQSGRGQGQGQRGGERDGAPPASGSGAPADSE